MTMEHDLGWVCSTAGGQMEFAGLISGTGFAVLTNPQRQSVRRCSADALAQSRLRVIGREGGAHRVLPERPKPQLVLFPAPAAMKKPPRSIRTLLQAGLFESVEMLSGLTL